MHSDPFKYAIQPKFLYGIVLDVKLEVHLEGVTKKL